MKKTVVLYEGETLKLGAKIAVKHKLYVSGWDLSYRFKDIIRSKTPRKDIKLSLVYIDDTPVAVAYSSIRSAQAFCRKSERKKGYGSDAVKAIPDINTNYGGYGLIGSDIFWSKVKKG